MIHALSHKDRPLGHWRSELQALEAKLLPVNGRKAVGMALKWPLSETEIMEGRSHEEPHRPEQNESNIDACLNNRPDVSSLLEITNL